MFYQGVIVILLPVKEMFLRLYTACMETNFMKILITEVNVCHIVWKIKWPFRGCWNHVLKCNSDTLLKMVTLCGALLETSSISSSSFLFCNG